MPFCVHHPSKKVKMCCDKESVPMCMLCIIAGLHKDHPPLTIKEANERAHENELGWLVKLEALIGEVEAALKHDQELTAIEEESKRQAAADMRQHFD